MTRKLSQFGQRFCADSGTFTLMDDLGRALTINPDMLFLGGGNPAHIPAVENEVRIACEAMLNSPLGLRKFSGNYQSPQGNPDFLQAIAEYLQRNCGWPVTPDNIALANGSQAAFFVLFNMFAGPFEHGENRKILLPMAPEYIGYESAGLVENMFVSQKPIIELVGDQHFKYSVNQQGLRELLQDSQTPIGAICLSRPTNPTGNVITDAELDELSRLAAEFDIPLIIDAAYGLPFPGILFNDAQSEWNENTVYLLSLSKIGLPGVRTGIIVASEEIISAYARANTALNLACSSAGPAITQPWFSSDHINTICRDIVQPFYEQACCAAVAIIQHACRELPVRIHVPQGAIFLWLWCDGLPISSQALYERLKARGVLVLSGHHFFIGLAGEAGAEPWPHQHQSLRVTYCQPEPVIRKAAEILAEELHIAYNQR